MKDMDAKEIMLAVVRQRLREGHKPARDVVLAFTATRQRQLGGTFSSSSTRSLFEVAEAIGEVGGFSVAVGDQRLYAVQTAEKGLAWRQRLQPPRAPRGTGR